MPRTPITNLAKNFRSSRHSFPRYPRTNLCRNWNWSSSSLRTFDNCSNFSRTINGVNVWISSPRRWKRRFSRHHPRLLHHLHIYSMNSYASLRECRRRRTHRRAVEIHWPPSIWTILVCLEQYSICLSVCLLVYLFILLFIHTHCLSTHLCTQFPETIIERKTDSNVGHIDVLVLALCQWRLDRRQRVALIRLIRQIVKKLVIVVDKNAIGNDLLIRRCPMEH